MKRFVNELKRRNVCKVAVADAVVGWLLIQIATPRSCSSGRQCIVSRSRGTVRHTV
jgi:hypothetical protein